MAPVTIQPDYRSRTFRTIRFTATLPDGNTIQYFVHFYESITVDREPQCDAIVPGQDYKVAAKFS